MVHDVNILGIQVQATPTITLEQAKALGYHTVLYHATMRSSDGLAVRARVNGKPKVWKREPECVRVPMKHGLRHYFYITQYELEDWCLTDPTVKQEVTNA